MPLSWQDIFLGFLETRSDLEKRPAAAPAIDLNHSQRRRGNRRDVFFRRGQNDEITDKLAQMRFCLGYRERFVAEQHDLDDLLP